MVHKWKTCTSYLEDNACHDAEWGVRGWGRAYFFGFIVSLLDHNKNDYESLLQIHTHKYKMDGEHTKWKMLLSLHIQLHQKADSNYIRLILLITVSLNQWGSQKKWNKTPT